MCNVRGVSGVNNVNKTEQPDNKVNATLVKRNRSDAFSMEERPESVKNLVSNITEESLKQDEDKISNSKVNTSKIDLVMSNISEDLGIKTFKPLSVQLQEKKEEIKIKSEIKRSENNSNLLQDTVDNSNKVDVKNYEIKIGTTFSELTDGLDKVDLGNTIKNNFSKEILKSGSLLTNQPKLCLESSKKGENLVNSLVPSSKLFIFLATKSDKELKDEIAKGIGLVKEKHVGKTYQELPQNKKELVDSILSGMKKSLHTPINEISKKLIDGEQKLLKEMIQNDNKSGDVSFGLTLKSELGIKGDIAKNLSMISEEKLQEFYKDNKSFMDSLSPEQQKFIDSIATPIIDTINTSIKSKTSSDRVNITNKDGKTYQPLSQITLDGKTYGDPVFLGEGGLANVYKYTNIDNPKESIVIKELKSNKNDFLQKRKEMTEELISHRHAMNVDSEIQGHKNVVSLKGAIKGPNDSLLMVVDVASGGDLGKVNRLIQESVSNGKISKETQSLLTRHLLRDVMDGMKYIQKDRNMQHLDLKPDNFLIKSDGTAMIGDFGTSRTDHDGWTDIDFQTTPMYLSPEVASRFEKGDNLKEITEKSDTWSLGAMLHTMTGGELEFGKMNGSYFRGVHEDNIMNFGKDVNNRIRKTTEDHPMLDDLDNLVNSMMHPDPNQRPNLSSVSQHSLFTDFRLDSPALKQLLEAIINGDEKRIDSLSKEVNDLVK